ncbi:phosphate ABC transporter permease family protein, partial [Leisingera sp.]|uniref:phosphate ABC transporter permease family protein n=1 Tax=Leisingera sp. TaxID=1879318 RepID=UPI002B27A2C4
MPTIWLVVLLLALAAAGFYWGRARALSTAGGDARELHSLPSYYGYHVALSAFVPAITVLVVWLLV